MSDPVFIAMPHGIKAEVLTEIERQKSLNERKKGGDCEQRNLGC